jgi:hypothetical protein
VNHWVDQLVRTREDLIPAFQTAVQYLKKGLVGHIIIKEYRDKRTIAQNNLMWKWNHQIAEYLTENTDKNVNQDDVHEYLCEEFWEKTINPLTLKPRRIETKKFSIKQMCEHLEKMEFWTGERQIPLLQPFDYRYAMYGEK